MLKAILSYLLSTYSKYKNTPDIGIEVQPELAGDPLQIIYASQYLNKHEAHDNAELRELLGVNPATTAWCAAFVNAIEKKCGRKGTGVLTARSFLKYGSPVAKPQLGDIVVFKRGNSSWEGHVGYYISEDKYSVLSLGGNQSNKVCYANYPISSVLGYRRPV